MKVSQNYPQHAAGCAIIETMQRLRNILILNRFGVIAFLTGFVLMAYEMIASRILAPNIGTSTYIWTSVIGVIIAALAVGYAVGGWLADRRAKQTDLVWLLLVCALAVAGTLLFYPTVLDLGGRWLTDLRLQALFDVTLLFMPASFIMGVISPYLTRLNVHSVATAGRAVASLSALNSIGGISGTFFTGFIFFSLIGSRETLALLVALLVAASWIVAPASQLRRRLAISGATLAITLLGMAPPFTPGVAAIIDTPTAHYRIVEGMIEGRPIRALSSGPGGWQSIAYTTNSNQLVPGYTRTIARIIAAAPAKENVLILGGGAFTLPEYLGRTYPESTIDVVEIDSQLEVIAADYFDYSRPANVHPYFEDARTYLASSDKKYDIIVIDVYNDLSVPFSLSTQEYTRQLRHILAPAGIVVANIVAAESEACTPLLASIDSSYRASFQYSTYSRVRQLPVDVKQNLVATYSGRPIDWVGAATAPFPIAQPSGGHPLTDNFAPIERLQQRCLQ